MDFVATETQSMLRDTAERLVRDRYGFEDRKKIVGGEDGFSRALWKEYADLGLLGVEIAEDFGGIGGSFADAAVVLEAFGKGLVVEPYLSTVILGAGLISAAGSQAQKEAILPAVVAGEMLLATAFGEPRSRFSLSHVETAAAKGADGWALNGHKAMALGGDSADRLIVSARTSGGRSDRAGITLFLVDSKAAGVTVRPVNRVDDRRAAEITLDNVRVAADAVIGGEGQGLGLVEAATDRGAVALCCEALGSIQALNELTLDYLKTRTQFGRPIGKFQALQHRMADMAMAEQEARSMLYYALDQIGERDAAVRAKAVSAAKAKIDGCGQVVGRGAIQLHGGIAMTMEYVAGHHFRRLTAIEKMMGDIDFHLARFALAG